MTLNDLPEIKMVRHARARNLRLRVEPSGIRLTIPLFCSRKQVQQFLAHSEQWLIDTWHKQQTQFNHSTVFPAQISLFHHAEPFRIIQQAQRAIFKFDWQQQTLFIREQQPEQALQAAVIAYAKQYLVKYLQQISQQIALPYQACVIRRPKTRWGSCSSSGTISLNIGLMNLPHELIDYVIIHELCHTRQMNHSEKFWQEVEKYDSDYKKHVSQIKKYNPGI